MPPFILFDGLFFVHCSLVFPFFGHVTLTSDEGRSSPPPAPPFRPPKAQNSLPLPPKGPFALPSLFPSFRPCVVVVVFYTSSYRRGFFFLRVPSLRTQPILRRSLAFTNTSQLPPFRAGGKTERGKKSEKNEQQIIFVEK